MNGRIYDPQLGRFLSADKFVQFPLNAQSFNRYSYVQNNPLVNVDPSGYTIERRVLSPVEAVAGAGGFGPPVHPEVLNSAIPKSVLKSLLTFVSAFFAADKANDFISNSDDPDVVGAPSSEAGGAVPQTGISENSTGTGADVIMPDSGSSPVESDLAGAEIETKLTDQVDIVGSPEPTEGSTSSSETSSVSPSTAPSKNWSTARKDYWKRNGVDGRAPQREVLVRNRKTGELEVKTETKELHHVKPRSEGGTNEDSNLEEVWPSEHEAIDPYRHTGYDLIEVLD